MLSIIITYYLDVVDLESKKQKALRDSNGTVLVIFILKTGLFLFLLVNQYDSKLLKGRLLLPPLFDPHSSIEIFEIQN